MKESKFVEIFVESARKFLKSNCNLAPLLVERGYSLIYALPLDVNLSLGNVNFNKPKRGGNAFQTDVCIGEKVNSFFLPRVVIEFKTEITTHDIITYSTKAGKHKQIYPWLRYGMIASEMNSIPGRFFIHNEHLDFFISGKNHKNNLNNNIFPFICKEVLKSKELENLFCTQNRKLEFFTQTIETK